MPKLFVLSGRDVGRSFDIEEGYVLGRSPDCQVRLHDRSVSRKHARVEREGDTWFLADLGSRNGLFVAGQRVAQAELVDHEEVSVGELPLRFRADEGEGEPPLASPSVSPALEELVAAEPAPDLEPRPEPKPAPDPKPGPPTLRSARPRVSLDDGEDELELEEDIELEAPTKAPAQGGAARAQVRESRLAGAAARAQAPTGFFSTDLTQRPLWVQGIVYLMVLAMAAGAAYGAYLLVEHLRATS